MANTEQRPAEQLGHQLFAAIWRAYRSLLLKSEASKKKIGLCDSDFRVLEVLLVNGPQPVSVLGSETDLTTGSITTAIDRLESRWLVVRKLDKNDRRIRMVELTSKGRRMVEQCSIEYKNDMQEAFRILTAKQQRDLIKLMDQIANDQTTSK
jgi:MarR family 2-MHQ and catechol resistance regulon transcriptional repressor